MSSLTTSPRGSRTDTRNSEVAEAVHRRDSRFSLGTSESGTARITVASAGDHPVILPFLQGIFQAPTSAEFQAQLEHPFYEPSQRLLIKLDRRIIGHVRMSPRQIRFGDDWLPVTYLEELATTPEYRGRGCASALLDAAEKISRQDGSVGLLLRCHDPSLLLKHNWMLCGQQRHSEASPREILAHLSATAEQRSPSLPSIGNQDTEEPVHIRLWRHVELSSLEELYREYCRSACGATERTSAYWQWLVSRRSCDRIYAALEGSPRVELDPDKNAMVGYASMLEGRVVELAYRTPAVRDALIARACSDAIERDHHAIRVDAPPNDSVHQLLIKSGGKLVTPEAPHGQLTMGKVFDPLQLLGSQSGRIWQRGKQAGLSSNTELGLALDNQRWRLKFGPRSLKIEKGKLGRSYLTLSESRLAQLLLGCLDPTAAIDQGSLSASTRVAGETAAALFPQQPFWLPPFDNLPARES